MTKKLIPILLFIFSFANLSFGQNASGELVSKRIADAMSTGKFYMKISGEITDDGETFYSTSSLAIKNGVTMARIENYGVVTLEANGYTFQLDEEKKTYTAEKNSSDSPDLNFGKLTFKQQGTCKLNGQDYYYDRYTTSNGKKITFYYNSKRVSAIDLDMKNDGVGVMNLIEFNASIPNNFYFCLGNDWKQNATNKRDIVSQYAGQMENINTEGLPEGINLQDIMSQNVNQSSLLEGLIDENDLPEGMSIDDILSMTNNPSVNNTSMPDEAEMRKTLTDMGMSKKEIDEYMSTFSLAQKENQISIQSQNKSTEIKPPQCSSPWADATPSLELATGNNQGAITISNEHASSTYVYMDQLDDAETFTIDKSLEVTADGVWAAFDQLLEETQGMSEAESAEYILQYNKGLISTAEVGLVTGDIIEKAVATCMICPTSINYNNTGMLFLCKNDVENALKYYKVAENMDPENASILVNISQCYFDMGNYTTARGYAERSAAIEPEYGITLQMLTSIYLKEKNYLKATETLFKCAALYFSEITASQFYSLYNAIILIPTMACKDTNPKEIFDQIFSTKNLELLTKATEAGFTDNEETIPANIKTFEWPYSTVAIKNIHSSLGKQIEENKASHLKLDERQEELLTDNPIINVYGAMGLQNLQAEIDNMNEIANSIENMPANIELPSMPNTDNYGAISQMAKKGANGLILLDARQYWCLQIWKAYYETLYSYWSGNWKCDSKNKSYIPKEYTSYKNLKDSAKIITDKEMEEYIQCLSICNEQNIKCMETAETERSQLECRIQELHCILPCNHEYFNKMEANLISILNLDKKYYDEHLRRILEEYWRKTTEMTAHCSNIYLQEYILCEVMDFINLNWQIYLSDGKIYGEILEQKWTELIINVQEELGESLSYLATLPADPPKLTSKKDVTLKEYGKKDCGFDIGVGINTPFGRLSLSREDENFKVQFANESTGKTNGYNFTKEEQYSSTTYETLADNPGSQDPSGYGKSAIDWAAKRGASNIIDMVGSVAKIKNANKFIPSSKSSFKRERIRTVDSKGNITDNGTSKFRKKEYSIGGASASFGRSETRSGNVIRTKNHFSVGFNLLDISIAK